jgi:DNA-binding GntR family transcriptional regulator
MLYLLVRRSMRCDVAPVYSQQVVPLSLSTPIRLQSLADHAFEKLVNAIVRGEIGPGERISEAQVARQLGISRGPLREALGRLEGRKLVERKPRIGVSVVGLSKDDLDELFTVREALEGMACRLAATRLGDDEIDRLRRLLARHQETEGLRRGTGYYQGSADEDFHFRIVRGSGSGRLIASLCDELYYQVRIYRYRSSMTPGRAAAAFEEHQQIVEALAARDPDRAEAAMRRHVANARANLVWRSEDTPAKARKALAV